MNWILMYSKLKILCIIFLFFSGVSNGYALDKKPRTMDELQVLIDVSGSMKHNDPHNLRIAAVKLLVNLLPEGTKAGIWLFAEDSKVLVEMGEVNEQWKKKALSRIKRIHSAGLFTHIENAIKKSAQAWFESSEQQNRNLILLTDGVVDVSKDIMQSAESRERVLVELVPLLQQAGVNIQAIALSRHADVALLDKLAFDTNGWSETAESAEQLQKIFFKMFKKAIPQDTVPIKDNMFTVDEAINEFSVLVFKSTAAYATQLITPDNKKIRSDKKENNVAWVNEKNYDLITIKKPQPGNWRIVAKIDPDNQVMIVTDLKFQVDDIPSYISAKDAVDLMAFFTEQQQLISRGDFLSLIDISVEQTDPLGVKKQWKMQPVPGKEGLFSQTIAANFAAGKHTIKIIADGKTFQRESIKTIKVVDSPIVVEKQVNQAEGTVTLKLIPDESLVNTNMMTVQAVINQTGKAVEKRIIEKIEGKWELVVAAPELEGSKVINFSVMAHTVQGLAISPDIKPVLIEDSLFSGVKAGGVEAVAEVEPEIISELDVIAEEQPPVAEDEAVNWGLTSAIALAVNSVLLVAGFFLFKFIKKKEQEKQQQLLGRLE